MQTKKKEVRISKKKKLRVLFIKFEFMLIIGKGIMKKWMWLQKPRPSIGKF